MNTTTKLQRKFLTNSKKMSVLMHLGCDMLLCFSFCHLSNLICNPKRIHMDLYQKYLHQNTSTKRSKQSNSNQLRESENITTLND